MLNWATASMAQTEATNSDRGLLQRFIEDNLSSAEREVRIEGFRRAQWRSTARQTHHSR